MITDKQVEAALVAWCDDLGTSKSSMRAALEAAEAAREPGDFVLVPREPTVAMQDEGAEAANAEHGRHNCSSIGYGHAEAVYRAMIAVAPSSAEQPAKAFDYDNARVVPPEEIVRRIVDKQFSWGAESPGAPEADERGAAVIGAPDRIWLNVGELLRDTQFRELQRTGDVSWCDDKIDAADVEYVRADVASAQSSAAPVSEWLERRLAIEGAAEARGESTDCTVCTPSALPSCLCCGSPGVAKCWHAERPEIYVCEQCHVKATATPPADARDGEDARLCDGVHPHVRARTLLTALWQRYDSGGESLGRSHYAVLLEAAMALLEEFRDRDDVARLNAKYADVVGATRDYLSKRMAESEGLPADRATGGE